MLSGEIAERHRDAELRARPGIFAAHYRLHVVAACVEAVDRLIGVVEHATVAVGAQAKACAERRRIDLNGAERRLFDRAEARVGLMGSIAVETVVTVVALAELGINARPRVRVVRLYGLRQSGRVDARVARELVQRVAHMEVTALDE